MFTKCICTSWLCKLITLTVTFALFMEHGLFTQDCSNYWVQPRCKMLTHCTDTVIVIQSCDSIARRNTILSLLSLTSPHHSIHLFCLSGEEVTCCRPAPCHLADFLSLLPQERAQLYGVWEQPSRCGPSHTWAEEKLQQQRGKAGETGRGDGGCSDIHTGQKKDTSTQNDDTRVTISFILFSN